MTLTLFWSVLQEATWQLLYFLSFGGYVLWSIFLINIVLWTLLMERYWYFSYIFPKTVHLVIDDWSKKAFQNMPSSWYAIKVKNMFMAQLQVKLNQHLHLLHTLVELLPILGLLGTIIAMIEMFEVLTLHGTGNARALAGSISKALITTLAGLMSAIPGMFLIALLQQKARLKLEQVADSLSITEQT